MILKKIKRTLAFTLLLAMLLSILPPVALAADTPSYEKTTSIAVGDKVIFVYEGASKELTAIASNIGTATGFSGQPTGEFVSEVEQGTADNTFAFKSPSGYLKAIDDNKLSVSDTKDADTSWTVAIDASGNAVITNVLLTNRVLQYNTSSPRFACYKNTQKSIQIYKLASGSEEPTEPTCEHANTTEVLNEPPACGSAGFIYVECDDCGEVVDVHEVPALGHNYYYDEDLTIAPGCETAGSKTRICENCGDEIEEPIPATGHSYLNGICVTCSAEEPDVVSYKLITLDDVKEGNYVIGAVRNGKYPTIYPATATMTTGSNTDWNVSDTAVTAAEDEITEDQLPEDAQIFILSGDNTTGFTIGFESNGEMQYLGYTSTANRKLAFGTEYASTRWTVVADSDGGFALSSTFETGKYMVSQNSTGTSAIRGYGSGTIYTGIYLFAEVTADEPACQHENKTTTDEKAATCTEAGYIEWACPDCGETWKEPLDIIDHSYDDGKVTTTPDCENKGEKTFTCSVCGDTKTEELPALGHNFTEGFCPECGAEDPRKDFTLTTTLNEGDQLVIYYPADGTALANVPSETKIAASTVTVNGTVLTSAEDTAVFTVSYVDDVNFTLQLADGTYLTSPAAGNGLSYEAEATEYSYWYLAPIEDTNLFNIMSTNAAYSGKKDQALEYYKGFTVYGLKDTDIYKFQLFTIPSETDCAHEWDEGVVTTDPTCYSEGEMTYTCTLCSETKTAPVPTLEHNYGDVIVTLPGCIDGGYTTYTCTNAGCEHSYVGNETPALGHDWIDATCLTGTYCSRCRIPGGCYVPVSSASELDDDDQIVIVANVDGSYKALSTDIASEISSVDVDVIDGLLASDAEIPVWTLVKDTNGYGLWANDTYLKHSNSTSFAASKEIFVWTFEDADNGIIIFSGSRGIVYRTSTINAFRAYATTNIGNSSYYGELLIFKYVEGATLPHVDNDNNNLCDACDSFIQPAALVTRSISLNGNIGVNFYMSLSEEVTSDPGAYMLFTQEGKEPVTVSITDTVARTIKGKQAYCFTYEVAAKEMTDEIKAQLFYGDTCTEEYTYSVKTYADNQREKMNDNQTLMNLLDAMLRYGAASQIQFGYNTDRLADEGMGPVNYTDVQIDGFPILLPQGTDLVSFAGASLILESETTLRFFLRADASVESFTVTYEGQPLEIKTRNGLYYADVENISAPNLDMNFTITVNDGTNTADITYSPLTYCASIRENHNTEQHQALLNVCAAIYLYNQAANAYFTPAG